jgi:hypothetical protein
MATLSECEIQLVLFQRKFEVVVDIVLIQVWGEDGVPQATDQGAREEIAWFVI